MATIKECLLTLKYYTLKFYVEKNIATLKQALKESLKKILLIIVKINGISVNWMIEPSGHRRP